MFILLRFDFLIKKQQSRQALKLSKVARPSHYPLIPARCYVGVSGVLLLHHFHRSLLFLCVAVIHWMSLLYIGTNIISRRNPAQMHCQKHVKNIQWY